MHRTSGDCGYRAAPTLQFIAKASCHRASKAAECTVPAATASVALGKRPFASSAKPLFLESVLDWVYWNFKTSLANARSLP